MEKLTYVTHNEGKYYSVKNTFLEEGIAVSFFNYDFHEPEINDIEIVSKAKAMEAYEILKSPCFVVDNGFCIDDYPNHPGFPGAFVNRSGIAEDIEGLLETMKEVKNRSCRFVGCLTFYDGEYFKTFFEVSEGTLSYEIRGEKKKCQKSNIWRVFIPKNSMKTLVEMSEEERKNRRDGHTSAPKQFAKWYKEEYLNQQSLTKRKQS